LQEKKDKNENKNSDIKIKRYQEELPLIRGIVSFNSFITLSPYAETTAIQTGDLLYRSFSYLESNRIGETYMLNSKSSRHSLNDIFGINLFMTPVGFVCEAKNEERYFPNDNIIKLTKPLPLKTTLGNAIIRRRSHRQFEDISTPFEQIASILYYSNGLTGRLSITAIESEFLNPLDVKLHTTSSAGGLYPLNIYLIAKNIKGLDVGIYLYSPGENALISVKKLEGKQFIDQIYKCFEPSRETIDVNNSSFIIIITGKIWKLIRKYGNRGLKYMFIESGEIAENIHLSAQSIGIGTIDVAGYYDLDVEKIIGIDGKSEFVMHTIIGGTI
jgi:SagB-type dehydrogenase family enzyme